MGRYRGAAARPGLHSEPAAEEAPADPADSDMTATDSASDLYDQGISRAAAAVEVQLLAMEPDTTVGSRHRPAAPQPRPTSGQATQLEPGPDYQASLQLQLDALRRARRAGIPAQAGR